MADHRMSELPRVRDPRNSDPHGVTIAAPTPTSLSIPNPWKPSQIGNHPTRTVDGAGSPSADAET